MWDDFFSNLSARIPTKIGEKIRNIRDNACNVWGEER